MADDAGSEAAQGTAEDGPLSSRLESKAWKTRMDAYDELTKLWESACEESSFEEFSGILHKAVADSNVNAQDKAIEAAIVFARKASTQLVARYASSIMSKAIDKAAGQAKCKSKVQDLALQFIEAEAGEAVAEELIKGCAHKQPKISGACAEALRMAVEAFGLRPLGAQSKAVVKLTVTMFDSTVAPVRSEAKPLAVELFKYMGAALRPSYDNLRPAQQKELDEAFGAAGPAQPTRLTRSAALKAASAAATGSENSAKGKDVSTSGAGAAGADVDPLEFLDPVEVLGKLPSGWCEKVLAAAKWQEKKEFLDMLIELAKSPKLASGDYSEVVKTLKRLMGDSMVLVVSTAITALSLLATGLRKEFKQCAQISLATLLDKFKEKDRRVIEAIHSALDALYGRCLSMVECSEELMTALGPKGGAKAKVEVLKFMKRAIDSKLSPVIPKNLKPLVDLVVKTTDDSAPEIRDGACAVLSSLLSCCGPSMMRSFFESLEDKKRKKIESMSESSPASVGQQSNEAESVASASAAPASKSSVSTVKRAAAPAVNAPAAKPEVSEQTTKKAKPPAGGTSKSAAVGTKTGATGKAASGQGKDDADGDVTAGSSLEELDAMVEDVISGGIRAKILSSNWKERLEGIEEFESEIKSRIDALQHPLPEAVTRLLIKSFVDKKETNFQVMTKVISVIALIAEKSPKFSKRAAFWCIPSLVEKLGDVKLRTPSHDCLLVIAESVTPQFVLTQAYEAIGKQKSPKTQENALLWANAMAIDFGLKAIKAKPLLELVKSMLEVANPGVKKAAVEVLITIRRQLGPDVRAMLADVKPALLATIDEAFAKVAEEAPTADGPKRQIKGLEGGDATADEVQIVNLTGPIAAHLKALSDANWKERQAAITAIEDIVVKAKPLGCTGPYMDGSCGELWAGLKARLKDSNKNLATQTLSLLAKIADAVGPSIDRYSKTILPNMLALISDNKKTVRDAVIACLSAWAVLVPPETVIKHLPVALSVDAPAGREDAVKWAADFLCRADKSTGLDISPILPSVMECLEHRVAEVRSGAERCLAAVIACGGLEAVNRCLRDLKPAQLKTLRPICDKAEKAAAALSIANPAGAVVKQEGASGGDSAVPPILPKAVVREHAPIEKEPSLASIGRKEGGSATSSVSGLARKVAAQAPKADHPEPSDDAEPAGDVAKALRCNGGKEAREKQHGKVKWLLDDAREAEMLLEALDRQMAPVSSEDVHAKLFSKDFKKQVDGIRDLVSFIPQNPKELTDNLDLVLKMCTLRMTGKAANTTLVLAVLELLRAVFEVLVGNDYRLSDLEASVCFPVLMEEVGSNNDGVRKLIRDLLKKATQVYPTSKIFSFLLDAAHVTRNQRSRAECLSEMTALVERLGLDQVCAPSKAVPLIANYVAERDPLVRNNAIECIVAAYQSSGDKVSKFLTKLEPKDRDILDAKLKKAKVSLTSLSTSDVTRGASSPKTVTGSKAQDVRASFPDASAAIKPGAVPEPVRSSMSILDTPSRASRAAINELLDAPTPSICSIKNRFRAQAPTIAAAVAEAPAQQEAHAPPEHVADLPDLRQCMEDLESSDLEQRVQAMKDLALHIEQLGGQPGATRSALGREVDSIVTLLQRVIADGAACGLENGTARAVKYALHAGHQLFATLPEVGRTVQQSTIGRLMEELLLLASSEAGRSQDDDMLVLSRGTEELIMDVLGGADPNAVFTTLIRFLYEGACLSGGQEPPADLISNVLRCLMEMARRMPAYMGLLRVDTLLYDAHLFLVAHPPSKYRGREFRPLRILKTILNELVKLKGEGIREHLTLVPVESKPTLCSYLDLVLQQHAAAGRPMPAPAVCGPPMGGPSAAADSICAIFERIGSKDKDAAKEGFRLLHAYQRGHPDFSLEQYLAGRSPQFQEHVHKSLAKVQAQADVGGYEGASSLAGVGTGGGGGVPLQNAMSIANRGAGLPSSASIAATCPHGGGASALGNAGAGGGGLLDKLQGIRSQLGIPSAGAPAAGEASRLQPPSAGIAPGAAVAAASKAPLADAEGPGAAAAAAAAPAMSTSVLSLQERLARLKNS